MDLDKLEKYKNATISERFNYFNDNLTKSNRTPSYYVDWDKVRNNLHSHELNLNTLNYLIGKEDIYEKALELFTKQPNLLKTIPILIACRDKHLDVLSLDEYENMSFHSLDFNNINTKNINSYVKFCDDSGLLGFLQKGITRTLVDYVMGVEVGLDTNARKNRSGKIMEYIINKYVTKTASILNLQTKSQATPSYIKENWEVTVPTDKTERNFDEAIYNPISKELWIIETNYYGGGGSKLKAVAGEFSHLNSLIKTAGTKINFVWVTDGKGWLTTKAAMHEAFGQINYIFNLKMVQNGYLYDLFKTQ